MSGDIGIAQILGRRAAERAQAEAFRFLSGGGAETLSYAELDRQAGAVARTLLARGAQGRPVLLLYPPGLSFIAALFGCFYAGAIAVPVPQLTAQRATERVAAIAQDAQPALGLTHSSLLDQLGKADAQVRALDWLATDLPDSTDEARISPVAAAESVALIQYTSGTTLAPRGVVLTHANLVHNLGAILGGGVRRPDDKVVSWLPMHHDMGLILSVLFPVYCEMPCALLSPLTFLQRPMRWLEAIATLRGTVSAAPCFAYDLCVRRSTPEQRAKIDLSSWRIAICGAEVVRPETLDAFASAFAESGFDAHALMPSYGLAESTLYVASRQGLATVETSPASLAQGRLLAAEDASFTRRLASCGWPAKGQTVAIVDPVTRERKGENEVGEIWVRGASVGRGYWGQEAATGEVFHAAMADEGDAGEWLRTGDLGAFSAEGLVVTGRRKDVLVIRGANFDPFDFETAAAESWAGFSAAAAAFAVETEAGEAAVLAMEVERSALIRADFAAVLTDVAAALSARFGVTLHDFVFLRAGALPRTTSGKVQRRRCRDLYLAGDLVRLFDAPHPALARWRPRRV